MMQLSELPRQLTAIRLAAKTLGCNVREVDQRLASIELCALTHPDASVIRQHIINIRGYDMPPQFGTSMFLDLQLERLIDMLATDAQRAELDSLAAR